MKQAGLKNTIVLKNLESNLIEEAVIVFKKNMKLPKINQEAKEKEYPLIEAEELINNYISKNVDIIDKKNGRYKVYITICTIIIIVQNFLIYFK